MLFIIFVLEDFRLNIFISNRRYKVAICAFRMKLVFFSFFAFIFMKPRRFIKNSLNSPNFLCYSNIITIRIYIFFHFRKNFSLKLLFSELSFVYVWHSVRRKPRRDATCNIYRLCHRGSNSNKTSRRFLNYDNFFFNSISRSGILFYSISFGY